MRSRRVLMSSLLALSFSTLAHAAAPSRVPTLVSTDWLARHLGEPGLVVLHASSSRADYDAGHVPGARYLGWASFTRAHDSLSVELPTPEHLDSVLTAVGVSDDSRIVIAGGPVTNQARLLMTLDQFGLGARASLLDGSIDAWRDEGRPLALDTTAVAPGHLRPLAATGRVVDAEWVREHAAAGAVKVVDARTPEFYAGLASNRDPRMGRLPTAGNAPYTWLTRELGCFREPRDLRRVLGRAGVAPGDTVVTYCHIGIQACVAYVAARALGHDVRLYDGAFEDWSRRAELPVESGPAAVGGR